MTESKKIANDWCDAVLGCDLRSTQLGTKLMKISSGYQRTNPKRALCFKIAAMCGNVFAGREYRKIMQEKIAGCQSEISKIPNLRLVTWGSGQQMGRFIPRLAQTFRRLPLQQEDGPPTLPPGTSCPLAWRTTFR